MIRPIGLPKPAITALKEFDKMGFKISPLEVTREEKMVTLATKSGLHPIDVMAFDMERAWGCGKSYKEAFIDLLTSISGKKFVTDINTPLRKEYKAPECIINQKGNI